MNTTQSIARGPTPMAHYILYRLRSTPVTNKVSYEGTAVWNSLPNTVCNSSSSILKHKAKCRAVSW